MRVTALVTSSASASAHTRKRRGIRARRTRDASSNTRALRERENDAAVDAPSSTQRAPLDWRYETIAGRCAMIGCATLPTVEITAGGDAWTRATTTDAPVVVGVVALVAWASTAPFEFNPQSEYGADPETLREKTGVSGFLAYEQLNLNVDVERAHGRLAMLAFAAVVALESAVTHRGLWAPAIAP